LTTDHTDIADKADGPWPAFIRVIRVIRGQKSGALEDLRLTELRRGAVFMTCGQKGVGFPF
jgi:hypothetical protein